MILPQIATFLAKPLIKYGVPAATVALLCLAIWIQGQRMHAWKVQAGAYKQTIAQMEAASDANHKAQLAQKAAVEQRYKELASNADQQHEKELADANDALRRYIASHRVRQASDSGVSTASVPAESGSAQGDQRSGSDAFMVAVSANDLEICTINTTRLQAAREWALGL